MALVTITKAIELSPVSRTQFYKSYVNTGKITVSTNERGKKKIDTAELLRVFGKLENTDKTVNEQPEVYAPLHNPNTDSEQSEVVKLLREQLAESRERENYYQTQIVTLTARLEAPSPNETPAPVKRQSRISKWWYGLDK